MQEQVIICPHCKKEIPLTEAISHQIREEMRKEFEVASKKNEKVLAQREHALATKEKEIEQSRKLIEEEVAQKVKDEKLQ